MERIRRIGKGGGTMKNLTGWVVLCAGLWMAASVSAAGIYSWTDAGGVRHFSNTPPTEGIGEIKALTEMPHDAQSDLQRNAEDRQAMEILMKQNEAEAEAQRRQEALEAKRRMEQAQAPPPPPPMGKNENKTAAKRERLIEAGRRLNAPQSQNP